MTKHKQSIDKLLLDLQERAKELNCLYQIEEILKEPDTPIDVIFRRVIEVIPPGWQYPDVCQAKITFGNQTYTSPGFVETEWVQSAAIMVANDAVGTIYVYYTKEMPVADDGPFLTGETKLIHTIAERLGHRIMHRRMRQLVQEIEKGQQNGSTLKEGEWRVVVKMLRQTDRSLYLGIARKMLNHLCWSGVAEAERLLQAYGATTELNEEEVIEDWNRPMQLDDVELPDDFSEQAFEVASGQMTDDEILSLIQRWIQEDKLSFLVQVVNRNLSLSEVADAIRRFHHMAADDPEIFSPSKIGILVSLIRRFLSDQLPYVSVAKEYIEVNDFYHLLKNVIFTAESHGKLGGKSAGLYLSAQILRKKSRQIDLLKNVKIPKTWHITSDVLLHFMHYNNFDEVVEQKYKEINQVRLEYPHIEQTFKNALFPADILKGLSMALDDFGDHPLIVRSSSLLEDRAGSAFSGKYKSLFLANQGTKQQRLNALTDAIAEVYASTFSPDPIEYRAERGLLDFGEEMGIMIQEVVGRKVGKYFLPAYAGVAFSTNEFRWSPRIKRNDGLTRIVPGLGTRAVDRTVDDYPILIAPGQPNLSVNVTPEEVMRYSPRKVDVINLETNEFETLEFADLVREVGYDFIGLKDIISVYKDGIISRPMGLGIDFENDTLVATFEGLITQSTFVSQMRAILQALEETLKMPVDIEFASDGKNFYLLQCRPQSYSTQSRPAPIPKDLSREQIIFSADKYVSNGHIPDITHIVYVDPHMYGGLSDRAMMLNVGRAVGRLNKLLPKRQFILMGPGRWGSRGDVKLGVNVTYSDINNTAALIEVAIQKGNYVPDLSFGTHFFQDLVEANIRYLPLYPDNDGVEFNERFLTRSENILSEVLPDFAYLRDTLRLIDVRRSASGRILRLLMNADLDEAVAYLTQPGDDGHPQEIIDSVDQSLDNFWHWRLQFAERIASQVDPQRFGVVGLYVIGSTKNATAGPGSDIDLLVHFRGSAQQRRELEYWMEGWSLCLAEMNYLRTGYRSAGLLDVHIITDKDIESKSSYAVKIGAVTDAARALPLRDGSAGEII